MFKKALITSAFFAASTGLAFANGGSFAPAPAPHHVGGFYAGVGLSRDAGHFKTKLNDLHTIRDGSGDVLGTMRTNANFDWSAKGIGGELFAGYGLLFQDRYYLALEGFGDISSSDGEFNKSVVVADPAGNVLGSATTRGKIEQQWSAGISLVPGVKITDSTMLYGRVGWIYSKFKVSGNIDSADSIVGQPLYGFDSNKGENGIQVGLGFETMVTPQIGLRGEWDWSDYQDIKLNSGGAVTSPVSDNVTGRSSAKIEPTVDQFKFAVLYRFNVA